MKIEIIDVIMWILFIIAIATGLWYLFGNSPTFEQSIVIFLISAVFGITITLTKTGTKLSYIEKDLIELKDNITDSFDKIKTDMGLIKKKLKI